MEVGTTPAPVLAYESLLYIYPEVLSAAVKAKELTLQVRVEVERDPEDAESPLKFLAKHSTTIRCADDVAIVQRKDKRPIMFGEMKMCLPMRLTPRSSLRFTFFHVELKGAVYKAQPFAVASLPLFRGGQLIEDGQHVLSLVQQMVSNDTEVRGYNAAELKKVSFRNFRRGERLISLFLFSTHVRIYFPIEYVCMSNSR